MRALALITCSLLLSGCFGGGDEPEKAREPAEEHERESAFGPEGEKEKELERARELAEEKIPDGDRVAYYILADASSVARRSAAGTTTGERITFAQKRLERIRPSDELLKEARSRLLGALETGKGELAAADATLKALNRYGGRHPEVFGLVPD